MSTATLLPPVATRASAPVGGLVARRQTGLAVSRSGSSSRCSRLSWTPTALGEMSDAGVFQGMSAQHWLGTDYLGRDMLVRIVAGTPYTIGVALVATLIACSAGAVLGLLAAVAGGWLDSALSRLLDTLISIPSKMFSLVISRASAPRSRC